MTDSLLPAADELELLHTRTYETRVYLLDDDTLLVRGAVMSDPGDAVMVDSLLASQHREARVPLAQHFVRAVLQSQA